MMRGIPKRLCIVAASGLVLTLAACATTSFTSTWKAPDVQRLPWKRGDKIVALVLAQQTALRHSGEASLAAAIDRAGLQGIPAYSLEKGDEFANEGNAKRTIDATQAVGAVVLRPLGKEQQISSTPSGYYGSPYYGGFWGGYYGYGWGGAWGGYEVRTDTYVIIETLIYDLRENKLIWAGQSKTMNPSQVESFVDDLAKAVSGELKKAGLVAAE
jgi:hypothetical protein